MADHPLRPARDRRLGEPLPHQLANPTWAYPDARGPKVPLFEPKLLCGISHRFQWLSPTSGQFPRHYSPVRRSTPFTFPEGSVNSFPLDLHVLGLPPAFNLSHDQTLQFKILVGSMNTDFKTTNVILKLLSFQQNDNELTVLNPKIQWSLRIIET